MQGPQALPDSAQHIGEENAPRTTASSVWWSCRTFFFLSSDSFETLQAFSAQFVVHRTPCGLPVLGLHTFFNTMVRSILKNHILRRSSLSDGAFSFAAQIVGRLLAEPRHGTFQEKIYDFRSHHDVFRAKCPAQAALRSLSSGLLDQTTHPHHVANMRSDTALSLNDEAA